MAGVAGEKPVTSSGGEDDVKVMIGLQRSPSTADTLAALWKNIPTHSMERSLHPLVVQISYLISLKDRPDQRSRSPPGHLVHRFHAHHPHHRHANHSHGKPPGQQQHPSPTTNDSNKEGSSSASPSHPEVCRVGSVPRRAPVAPQAPTASAATPPAVVQGPCAARLDPAYGPVGCVPANVSASDCSPISSMVSLASNPAERNMRALARVGQAVNLAVERFVTVGETIADDNPEIKIDMYEACKEARRAGSMIERLCDFKDEMGESCMNRSRSGGAGGVGSSGAVPIRTTSESSKAALVGEARALLSAVTRVLLLADTVVVRQLILAKDKVTYSLNRLENVTNFTEFVKAFSQFGCEMVDLAHLSGDRQTDLKDERRRAQMAAARQVLERSTMMLLTSSKACLRHPDCRNARENRDTVFCQMRRAMDLIHYVVKEGVLDYSASSVSMPNWEPQLSVSNPSSSNAVHSGSQVLQGASNLPRQEDWDANQTIYGAIKRFEEGLEMARLTEQLLGPGEAYREKLTSDLDLIIERTQDFTDSAYTSHEHRENILLLCDRAKLELNQLLKINLEPNEMSDVANEEFEGAINATLRAMGDLRLQLQYCALDQARELINGGGSSGSAGSPQNNGSHQPPLERSSVSSRSVNLSGSGGANGCGGGSGGPSSSIIAPSSSGVGDESGQHGGHHSSHHMDSGLHGRSHPLSHSFSHAKKDSHKRSASAGRVGTLATEDTELLNCMKASAVMPEFPDRLKHDIDRFHEHVEHMQEMCKMMRHVTPTDSLQVAARYTEINLKIYGPQVATAANILCLYPTSKIAKDNMDVFCDMWSSLVNDVRRISRQVAESCRGKPPEPDKQVYLSLPRPGKHGTTSKPLKPAKLDSEEQAKIAKAGLEMKLITSEMDAETEKWMEKAASEDNNDIVKRAKNMSAMAFSMYQFTKGEGSLNTTQDLFTQAEYFAEEANRLYKVVRQFSYQVPQAGDKIELLEYLDKVPTYVQQLQFTVKNPTVGKAATFTKVDHVIQETKNLMNVISKVVTTCFVCATKYDLCMPESVELNQAGVMMNSGCERGNSEARLAKYNLDFRGLSPRGRNVSPYGRDDDVGSGATGMEGGKYSSAPSSDPSI